MGIKLTANIYFFNLSFADDQEIIAQEDDLDYMMRKLLETYGIQGLNINFGKTEYLTSGYKENLIVEGKTIKNVSHFMYLGFELQEQGETNTEIKRRISIGRREISTLNSVVCN